MRSTGFYLARPTHDGVPRQAGRQGHGSDTSPTQIIGFARGPLSAHSLIHQPRQRPVFIPYPLDDGFVLREGMFLHITTAGNTYLIMLLFRGALSMIRTFEIEAIAIGNGTASRETEMFVKALKLPSSIPVVMVSESGASIYSASEVAREEFPNHDLTVRGAVSIGRRLMDPLAELVKLDPKSIGVGQYQHDVDQFALKRSLDDVVMSCVNGVGVELNTSSKQLLAYVSGLGPALAEKIVAYRNENGPFKSRAELKRVPRLGPKAFEQAAGFLRIP